jgi:hypothetical protein
MFLELVPVIEQLIQVGSPVAVSLINWFQTHADADAIAALNAMLATDEAQKAIILHELDITAPKTEPAA